MRLVPSRVSATARLPRTCLTVVPPGSCFSGDRCGCPLAPATHTCSGSSLGCEVSAQAVGTRPGAESNVVFVCGNPY